MCDSLVKRSLWTIGIITAGAIAVSVFVVAASAPFMPHGGDWRRFALGIVIAAVAAPVLTFPVVRANYLLRSIQAELKRLALTDPLSGLPNRRAFFERAREIFALPAGATARVAVMMVDIDRFKAINDRYGHDVGDAIIQAVGRTIGLTVMTAERTADRMVSRFGGEEYAVVIAGITKEAAIRLADDVCRAIRDLVYVDRGASIKTTVSVGVIMRADGQDIDAALRAADCALYEAKRSGRDRAQLGCACELQSKATLVPAHPKRLDREPLCAA